MYVKLLETAKIKRLVLNVFSIKLSVRYTTKALQI